MSRPTILITGANRGIGAGYVTAFLERGFTVIAAARHPASVEQREHVIPIKIDSLDAEGPKKAVEELRTQHGIDKLDIVLANAGVFPDQGLFAELSAESAEHVWRVNVLAPLMLYQATLPLIPKGGKGKFVVVGSRAGVLSIPKIVPAGAYGQSKAAVHFLIKRLHYENEEIVSFAILPGHVVTDMGNKSAATMGMDEAPRKLSETLPGMIKVIMAANRDQHGGKLCEWDGTFSDW